MVYHKIREKFLHERIVVWKAQKVQLLT